MRSLEPPYIQFALQYFDSGTASRGREYFRAGRVISCECLDSGSYRFEVRGSLKGLYSVSLKFNSPWLESTCTCPMLAYCKHVYASLLFLKQNGDLHPAGQTLGEQRQSRTGFLNLVSEGRALSGKEVDFINRLERLYRTHQRGGQIDGFALRDLFPSWKIAATWLSVRIAPAGELTRLQFWHFLVAALQEQHASVPAVFGESSDIAPSLNIIPDFE